MKHVLEYAGVLLLAMIMSGCAIGNKYKIADVEPQITSAGNASVAVASLDKRSFILDHTSPITYVGMVRGGYGNPFNATTLSNLPFADAVSKAICQALNRKGFQAIPVTVQFEMAKEQATKVLLDKNMDKSILVVIKAWESDSFYNLNIGYDFVLKVLDRNGTILATSEAKDKVEIFGNIMTGSLALSKKEVPAIFQKAIATLLNDPAVASALSG
ncbi:MAG TPA: hypothetical protein ENG78_06960 [Acidiferrobacteraceae bacterium]|nr:hypothetical protein [Acidiferrobacteraceae bacterium]HEX20540.1 hypothetical protein [Acidiferrobacteraceae bacterium]